MSFDAVFKYFPSPNFLNPPHVGVSLSDFSLKMSKFGGMSPSFTIDTLLLPLEPGIVSAGSVLKSEELAKKIAEAKPKFRSNYSVFTIPDEFTYVFKTSVPVIKPHDLTEAVAATLEENVPMSFEDTLFDFVTTSITHNEKDYTAEVVVVACVKSEVEKLASMLKQAGLEPLACLPESQAVIEAVIPKDMVDTACVVHARDNRVAIYLANNRTVQFVTIRNVAKGDYAQEFLDEYSKFVEYISKYGDPMEGAAKNIYVCGEFEYAKQVILALNANGHKGKSILANVWNNVFDVSKHAPDLPYEVSLSFAGSVGAAISKI